MNLFKRTKTTKIEEASALQMSLLQEAERNIYGDTLLTTSLPIQNSLRIPDINAAENTKNNYGTGKSLFPLLDHILYIFPMWITRDRRHYSVNFIGLFVTWLFSALFCFDAVTGGHYSGLDADNLKVIGSAYKIVVAGNAVWIPIQIICQLRFHKKYFKVFWTDDKRDNRMIYFVGENNKYKKIYVAIFLYLFIKIGLAAVYTFAAFIYTRDYIYSNFIFNTTTGFVTWQIIKFIFFYVPRSLHGIVIFLYCLEWKFRIRYFWKLKFIEHLHDGSLLKRYKKMQQFMDYQLYWIKGWMQADFLAIAIAIWYWLWIWFQYRKVDKNTEITDLVIEGLGYILYHSMGFVLTWFMGAAITTEADALHKCATKILEKLNEQHFNECFVSEGFDTDCEKLVDYNQIDLNETNESDITGFKESNGDTKRRSSWSRKYRKKSLTTDDEFEANWKSLIDNKNIVWEEWIYENNCAVNNVKDEMKRSCLIKQLQAFILYYNKHPCVFRLGIVLRYTTMFKIAVAFAAAKLIDYLWGFTAIS